jgi:hypothetical protein
VHECDCVACIQKLTQKDVEFENRASMGDMFSSGILSREISCVRSAMERIVQLFDILNTFTTTTSIERMVAAMAILFNFDIMADRLMFPA